MPEKEKSDFVVSDRRKFTVEGERRSDVVVEEERKPEPPAAPTQTAPAATQPAAEKPSAPEPPSHEEQTAQHSAYRASNQKLDQLLGEKTGRNLQDFEMTFERLVASLYMTAMLQLGLMAPEGEQPRADIMGARQTIDSLGVLNEKTKGNLTPAEQGILQNALFELRMAYLELTNAIIRGPQGGPASSPGAAKK